MTGSCHHFQVASRGSRAMGSDPRGSWQGGGRSRTGRTGSPDNAARGHAGAKTAAASHGTWPSVATWSNGGTGADRPQPAVRAAPGSGCRCSCGCCWRGRHADDRRLGDHRAGARRHQRLGRRQARPPAEPVQQAGGAARPRRRPALHPRRAARRSACATSCRGGRSACSIGRDLVLAACLPAAAPPRLRPAAGGLPGQGGHVPAALDASRCCWAGCRPAGSPTCAARPATRSPSGGARSTSTRERSTSPRSCSRCERPARTPALNTPGRLGSRP